MNGGTQSQVVQGYLLSDLRLSSDDRACMPPRRLQASTLAQHTSVARSYLSAARRLLTTRTTLHRAHLGRILPSEIALIPARVISIHILLFRPI